MDIRFLDAELSTWCLCSSAFRIALGSHIYRLKGVLRSGGDCWIDRDNGDYVKKGPWTIVADALPAELREPDVVKELEVLVNANIPEGCCGGCL